ncbi:glycosyltransferase family 1 protein [Catalinimonas sp. 4WD22]|uniref:glycosyltransferase family 4 protein n=1 Tax=Catalinimonas locisalis TaxID=3133978 RepID=UPI003100B4C9
MPRFTHMLAQGMKARGHQVEIWEPKPMVHTIPTPISLKKWLGYIDQYVLFPYEVRRRIKSCQKDTLFVFTDQALGLWIPLVSDRPHVVHCHDFLAQRSALDQIPENPTKLTGRWYQAMIRYGFRKGRNFISVSNKTKQDLHQFLSLPPLISELVYNGLNQSFAPQDPMQARSVLSTKLGINLHQGFILHVGGNQWYKNRKGVIDIYNTWREKSQKDLPLLMIGKIPDAELQRSYNLSPYNKYIHLLTSVDDELLKKAYAGASVLLFPSLAEGFGWPIAEAMACGCPVITIGEAPMTEVGGGAAFYIEKRTDKNSLSWALKASAVMDRVLRLSETERQDVIEKGIINTKRFDTKEALDQIEAIYIHILQSRYRKKKCTKSSS